MQSKQAINTWIIFAVVCLVAWPFKESEAGDDIVLLEICMLDRAPVAQLIEHRSVTREVVSSTPVGPTLRVLK